MLPSIPVRNLKGTRYILVLVFACLVLEGSLRATSVTLTNATFEVSGGGSCPVCTPFETRLAGTSPFRDIVVQMNGYGGTNIKIVLNAFLGAGPTLEPEISTSAQDLQGTAQLGNSLADAVATVLYQAAVVPKSGAPPVNSVPVDVFASGSANCSSSGLVSSATSSVDMFINSTSVSSSFVGNCPPNGAGFQVNNVDQFFVNTPIDVTISSEILLGTEYFVPFFNGFSSGSAQIDPVFQIDPSFPFANDFTLIYSPNLTISGSVPEPSSLLLLGSGLVAAAFAMRRKRHF